MFVLRMRSRTLKCTRLITVNSDMVELMKTATDFVIKAGEQNKTKIEVTGLGVGTKTVGGKTYVAIGYKLSK